jgi:hypothetical protein
MSLALAIACLVLLVGFLSDIVLKRRKVFLMLKNTLTVLAWSLALYIYTYRKLELMPLLIALLALTFSIHTPAPPMAKEPYGADYAAVTTSFFNILLFVALAIMLTVSAYLSPRDMCIISIVIGVVATPVTTLFAKDTYRL